MRVFICICSEMKSTKLIDFCFFNYSQNLFYAKIFKDQVIVSKSNYNALNTFKQSERHVEKVATHFHPLHLLLTQSIKRTKNNSK